MKRILFLSAFVSTLVYCQQGNANVNNSPVTRESLLARAGYVNPLETKGSPYLYAEYKKARIANNQKLVDMRYNAYKDEVDIINNGKNMTIYKNPEYSPIHIIDSDEILYLLEYPYNGKKVIGYLFEVKKLETATLLMRISKTYDKGKYARDFNQCFSSQSTTCIRVAGNFTCQHMGWWSSEFLPHESDELNYYAQHQTWSSVLGSEHNKQD